MLDCTQLSWDLGLTVLWDSVDWKRKTVFIFFPFFFFFWFFKTGFLYSFGACPGTSSCTPGWPRTHREPPASASQVLLLKACATTAQLKIRASVTFTETFICFLSHWDLALPSLFATVPFSCLQSKDLPEDQVQHL